MVEIAGLQRRGLAAVLGVSGGAEGYAPLLLPLINHRWPPLLINEEMSESREDVTAIVGRSKKRLKPKEGRRRKRRR
ncbi:hypothetical protein ACLOJK_028945 [Asimina triloba]